MVSLKLSVRRLLSGLNKTFNPIWNWTEQKRLDREANILIAQELASAIKANSETANKALDIANKFLDSFKVEGEPESRVVRNDDEIARYMQEYGLKKDAFSADEDPFVPLY